MNKFQHMMMTFVYLARFILLIIVCHFILIYSPILFVTLVIVFQTLSIPNVIMDWILKVKPYLNPFYKDQGVFLSFINGMNLAFTAIFSIPLLIRYFFHYKPWKKEILENVEDA